MGRTTDGSSRLNFVIGKPAMFASEGHYDDLSKVGDRSQHESGNPLVRT